MSAASDRRTRIQNLLVPSIALLAGLGIAVFWILSGIRSQADHRLGSSLYTVLETTDKALRIWVEQTEEDVTVLAGSSDLRRGVEEQLRAGRDVQRLRTSSAMGSIRQLLSPAMAIYQFAGFAIIAPDGGQIAAHLDDAVGMTSIAGHNRACWPMLWQEKSI